MNVLDAMQRLMVLVEPRRNHLGQCAECGTPLGLGAPHIEGCSYLAMPQIVKALEGIVSDDLTVAELCDTHAKFCGGTWPGCVEAHGMKAVLDALKILERISKDEHEDDCPVPGTILMHCFCSQKMAKAALGGKETD